ncbi:two-component system sensor histidine kinase VicK [Pedobacter africanus]|uniref:Signal transduction histidine kinase n=1 Tax=Pedobacter africanus TaxID=151894 RepID=A0ACC6KV54_9SPHI|nr:HAMP domain-containing sensor histidine kinase [Pedobacter africanus]MDR6783029.1 signal transduction histidine kinase [Pedobacter africanus]
MLSFYTYQTPNQYAQAFKEAYSIINVKQVRVLSSIYFFVSVTVRMLSLFSYEGLSSMTNYSEYSSNNWLTITGSLGFLLLSNHALKSDRWTTTSRNILIVTCCCFILTTTFAVSYIFSLHNPKNTLAVFLIGIMMVSLFFALEVKQIVILSLYVFLLFGLTLTLPGLNLTDKVFNFMAAFILVVALYTFSRYSYYFKSKHFTQLKQLEERNLEVQLLNHQKSEILGFVAHDLRNPLNNIEALTRIVLEESQQQDNTEMQLILSSTRQAKNIIDDLLEIAQNNKAPFQLQTTDIITFMNNICSNWQKNLNNERKIVFSAKEQELTSAIDLSKLTRVIDNLIGNGLKFSKADAPINIAVSRINEQCHISIEDFGIGIPDHLQTMLFDQFSRAGRPGLKGERSIGLGLHISRQIIEQHKGTLTVQSRENEGSTFTIALPINKEAC